MLKSDAARGVLVLLLAIAAFELGITGKIGKIWTLAFTGDPSKQQQQQQPGGQKPPPLPGPLGPISGGIVVA